MPKSKVSRPAAHRPPPAFLSHFMKLIFPYLALAYFVNEVELPNGITHLPPATPPPNFDELGKAEPAFLFQGLFDRPPVPIRITYNEHHQMASWSTEIKLPSPHTRGEVFQLRLRRGKQQDRMRLSGPWYFLFWQTLVMRTHHSRAKSP